MRVLVTNDDGVDSVGIQVLAAALADSGEHEVQVVAPDSDRSGTGASLGRFDPDTMLEVRAVSLPEAPGVEAWALDGTPAMCVLAAALGGFGERPDVVVSGINAGANTGRAVLHSGTVGAVLTGQNFGMSGLAVSVAVGDPWRWDTAAAIAVDVLDLVLDGPPRSVLNLNVPALPRHEVKGVSWARLAPFGEVRAAMRSAEAAPADDDSGEPRRLLQMTLELSEADIDADSDQGLLRQGFASLTTLVGVVEAWPSDEGLGVGPDLASVAERMGPGAPLHEAHRLPDGAQGERLRRPLVVGEDGVRRA